MLRLLRLRRSGSSIARSGSAVDLLEGDADVRGRRKDRSGRGGGGGAALWRLRCTLLLHIAWLTVLILCTASSIWQRQQRHLLLARQLLAANRDAGALAGATSVAAAGAAAAAAPGTQAVVDRHPDLRRARECGEALQMPQVALLFLAKGEMHQEVLWQHWFQSAAGLLPVQAAAAALCSSSDGGSGGSGGDRGDNAGSGDVGLSEPQRHRQQLWRLQLLQACSGGGSSSSGGGSGGDAAAAAQLGSSATALLPVAEPESGSEQQQQQQQQRDQEPGQLPRTAAAAADSSRHLHGRPRSLRSDSGGSGSSSSDGTLAATAASDGSSTAADPAAKGAATGAAAAATAAAAGSALDQQLLFDVYVHPHPSFQGYPPGSVFQGRELAPQERVVTEWGQHSLVDATRALLRAAYRNPRNLKFVLLSESDLPLYSPLLLYTQLMGEARSRINACNTTRDWRLFPHRWVRRMETEAVKEHHWRKSWQWFALSRAHVELVLRDTAVDAPFRAHCRTMADPERDGKERECYSDEHYIPTLLAVHGRDNETDCQGWLMDTDWSRIKKNTPHPWHYQPGELRDSLLQRLRHPRLPGCAHAATAAATARGAFLPAEDLAATAAAAAAAAAAGGAGQTAAEAASTSEAALAGVCRQLGQQQHAPPLGPQCRLFARKFLNETTEAALAAVVPCDSSALVLNDGTCPGETARQAAWRRRWQRAAPLVLLASGSLLLPLLAALLLGVACTGGGSGSGSGSSGRGGGRR